MDRGRPVGKPKEQDRRDCLESMKVALLRPAPRVRGARLHVVAVPTLVRGRDAPARGVLILDGELFEL